MENQRTQWYIGAPNGIVLCIREMRGHEPTGHLYHSYSSDAQVFHSFDEMTLLMERLYEALQYPHPGTNRRSFVPDQPVLHIQERNKVMSDEDLLSKHGDIGTFIVRVQHRQNSSWQGRLTWMEKDQTLSFRSVWEMIKQIESAMDTISDQGGADDMAVWKLPDETAEEQ